MSGGNPAPVIIAFETRGDRDVTRAFDSLENRMARFERGSTGAAQRGARDRVSTTDREARERGRAFDRAAKLAEKAERDTSRAAAKESALREKQVEREAARRERIVRSSALMAGRIAEQQANTEIRAAQRAAREVERIEAQKARASTAARRRFASNVAGTATHSLGGTISTAGRMVGAALAIGGGLSLTDAVRKNMSAEHAAAQLANSATINGVRPEGANVQNIMKQAGAVAIETGVDKGDLISAVQNYVAKSSDFAGGMENMSFFAKMSKANGARLEDITGAAGILRAQNKNLSGGDMRQMMLDLQEQGKQGAVEIQDMAHLAGALGSTRGLYAGNVAENQRKLMGLAQLTRTESESPEEAATAVKDLGIEAAKHMGGTDWKSKALRKKMGVKFTKKGEIEDLGQMIEASLLSTKGNLGDLEKIYGMRGVKTFQRLAPVFNAAGGGDKGIAAVRAEMATVMNARGSQQQLDAQYSEVMKTKSERLGLAFQRLQEAMADRAIPFLERFADKLPQIIPKLEKAIDSVGHFAEWFVDNPLKGIGAVVFAAVAKDLAGAMIGEGIKRALTGIIAGGAPGAGGAGALGGGAAGPLAAFGALAVVGGAASVQATLEGQTSGQYASGQIASVFKRNEKGLGNIEDVQSANATIAGANEAKSGGGVAKLVASAYTYVPDKVQQLVSGDSKASVLGDQGGDFLDRLKKFAGALEITQQEQAFKGGMTAMAEAATQAAEKLKSIAPTKTDTNAPGRNQPISERPVK